MPPRVLCICILWLAIGKKQTRQEEETAATAAVGLRWQHSRLLHVASRAHTHTDTLTCRQQHNWRVSYSIYGTHSHTDTQSASSFSLRYLSDTFGHIFECGCGAKRPAVPTGHARSLSLSLSLSTALSHTLSLSDSPSLPLLLIITKALTLFDDAYPWDTRCFCLLMLLLLLLPLRGLSPVSFFCRFLGDLVSKRTCRKTNTSSPRADVVSARVQLQLQQEQQQR